MEEYARLCGLMVDKEERFMQFELVTQEMLTCETHKLDGLIEERERLIESVDALNAAVEASCAAAPDPDTARAAMRNECEREGLSHELVQVYDTSRRIRACVSRLRETDFQAAMRLRAEQEQILGQIRDANRGAGAQASRFYGSAFGAKKPGSFTLGQA